MDSVFIMFLRKIKISWKLSDVKIVYFPYLGIPKSKTSISGSLPKGWRNQFCAEKVAGPRLRSHPLRFRWKSSCSLPRLLCPPPRHFGLFWRPLCKCQSDQNKRIQMEARRIWYWKIENVKFCLILYQFIFG